MTNATEQQQAPTAPDPAPKRRKWPWVVAALFVIGAIGNIAEDPETPEPEPTAVEQEAEPEPEVDPEPESPSQPTESEPEEGGDLEWARQELAWAGQDIADGDYDIARDSLEFARASAEDAPEGPERTAILELVDTTLDALDALEECQAGDLEACDTSDELFVEAGEALDNL